MAARGHWIVRRPESDAIDSGLKTPSDRSDRIYLASAAVGGIMTEFAVNIPTSAGPTEYVILAFCDEIAWEKQ